MGTQYIALFLLFIFINSVLCSEEYPCSGTCDPTQQTVFKVGHTYVYVYVSDVITSANISDDADQIKVAGFTLTSDVEIYILSPCELIMKIDNANLESTNTSEKMNSDEIKTFSEALTKNNVLIHYSNGSIPEICTEDPEPSWVLNVKRGIISLLQYSTEDVNHTVVETDIQGICQYQYTTKEVDGWRIIKKRCDLSRCTNRGGPNNYLNNKMQLNSYIYPLDLFKSSRMCKYVLGDTLEPVMVTCKERHRFLPFYTAWNMFVTNVYQTLTLNSVILNEMPVFKDQLKKENMFFSMENQKGELITAENINDILAHLTTVNTTLRHSLLTSPNVMALFRNATYQELQDAFDSIVTTKERTKWDLLDIFFLLKTEESIRFVLEVTQNGDAPTELMNYWLYSLPFVRNPTIEMLNNLQPAFDIIGCKKAAFLGISGMVYIYCAGRDNCFQEAGVAALVGRWEAALSHRAETMRLRTKQHRGSAPRKEYSYLDDAEIMLSLKAVGNAGQTNNLKTIMDIIQDRQLSRQLRIAAIKSLRRMPNIIKMACEDLSKLLQGIDDVEVRIASYLIALKCEPSNLLQIIKFQLQYEETNEVTSFMWNHLAQTLSQLPEYLRGNITELFHDEFFRSKYQLDIGNSASFKGMNKSFSTLKTNLVADRKIINKNRLAWAAAFNVELSMFTNKTDIFEFNSNFRDVSSLIEAAFGRKNMPKKHNPETFSDHSQEDHENNFITDEHTELKEVKKSAKQLEVELSVKILGNELYTFNISDFFARLNRLHKEVDLRSTLAEASEEFKDEQPIMNTMDSYTFPTSIGFPLEIGVNSTLIWLMALSNVTVDNRESPLSKFDLAFDMTTGLTLNVSGSMLIDAHIFKRGLHLTIDSFAQNNIKCSLNLVEEKRADYKFEMPENQNNRFNLDSNVEEIF